MKYVTSFTNFILNFFIEGGIYHTRQELIKGMTEIRYQRHMLENLGRCWFSVFLHGQYYGLLIYFFSEDFPYF